MSAADLVVVSKNDLLDDAGRDRVKALVERRVPAEVKTAYINHGDTPLEVLMGMDSAAEERIDAIHNYHDHHHAHGHHHDHAHDHFDSFVITLGEVDAAVLERVLNELMRNHSVYRIKGFAALPGKPMRQVIQAVGQRLDRHFDRQWEPGEAHLTQLVFIGQGIDQHQFTEALQTALAA